MQVFIDGSEVKPDDARGSSQFRWIAWGCVINHDDTTHEFHGGDKRIAQLKGCHEFIALIEGVLRVGALGGNPVTATYHTDCDVLPYFAYYCHEQNYKRVAKERVITRLKMICDKCYDDSVYKLVLDTLLNARFIWIKGHQRHVYHSRCDYLAKYASRMLRNIEMVYTQFDEWISGGFTFYHKQGEDYQWYPPFANSK